MVGGEFMDLLHLHEIKNKMIGNYISSVEYYTTIIKNTSDMAIWIKGLRYLEEMMNRNRIINECIMTNMFSLLMEVHGDL